MNKEYIRKELLKAKEGKHICNNPESCMISGVTPIVVNIKTEEAMDALINLVFFVHNQITMLQIEKESVFLDVIEMEDTSVNLFKRMLDIVEENYQRMLKKTSEEKDPRHEWLIVAKEAGLDEKSILALCRLINLIKGIFEGWERVLERKEKMKKIKLN